MKEQIINYMGTIIIIMLGALIAFSLFDLISRAQIYTDNVDSANLEICLNNGLEFEECYIGIFNSNANFKK